MVDLVERLDVLLKQEVSEYKTVDYMLPAYQQSLRRNTQAEEEVFMSSTGSQSSASSSSPISEVWREKISQWNFEVVDHFNFSREVVSVAMHYLDRYLATRLVSKKTFQLAAMTSLFLAIKLYETGRISMTSMIELSRGYFKVEQMVAMETSILRALKWQVHPPNAYTFTKHSLFLVPYSLLDLDTRHRVLELARFLTELSATDYFFVVHRPSVVSTAAILNSMETVPGAMNAMDAFARESQQTMSIDTNSLDVTECRTRLRLLYTKGGYDIPVSPPPSKREETISPVCVSYGTDPYSAGLNTRH